MVYRTREETFFTQHRDAGMTSQLSLKGEKKIARGEKVERAFRAKVSE